MTPKMESLPLSSDLFAFLQQNNNSLSCGNGHYGLAWNYPGYFGQGEPETTYSFPVHFSFSVPPTCVLYCALGIAAFCIFLSLPFFREVHQALTKQISHFLWNLIIVTVTIDGPKQDDVFPDRLYHYLLKWCRKNLKELSSSVALARWEKGEGESEKLKEQIQCYPGFDSVINFRYKGKWIQLERVQTPEIMSPDSEGRLATYERIVLTTFWHNRSAIYQLLEECKPEEKDEAEEKSEKKTTIYGIDLSSWTAIGDARKPRMMSSMILKESVKERLMKDVKKFKDSEEIYEKKAIPYRRSYLVHGPHGCGKSSLVRSIAGEFGYNICSLSLVTPSLNDFKLNELLNSAAKDSIILLEDVDVAFQSKKLEPSSNDKNLVFGGMTSSNVTRSGLLDALDGVASSEGKLIFMTTNHPEMLDPAVIRPGRVDMKIKIDYPTDNSLGEIFAKFHSESGDDMKAEFVRAIREIGTDVSMAAVQGLLVMYLDSPQECVENVKKYFKDQILDGEEEEEQKIKTRGIYT